MPIYYTCNHCNRIIFVTCIADCTLTTLYKDECPLCGDKISIEDKPFSYKLEDKNVLFAKLSIQLKEDLDNGKSIFICNEGDLNRIRHNIKFDIGRTPNILRKFENLMKIEIPSIKEE